MTPGDAALRYAVRGWRLFPCRQGDKHPLTSNGFHDAVADPDQVRSWWCKYPNALIGFWPGPSDIAVLDVDMKNGKDGLATLAHLDTPILSATPTVHTPSGGLHLHFAMPAERIGITTGEAGRGIGVGLDWRGDLGYAILPSSGSGYRWGRWHYGNCTPVAVPSALVPKAPPERCSAAPPTREGGLTRYGEGALDKATAAIINAAYGEQEAVLNGEAWSIGTLAAAGGVPAAVARAALLWAARQMPDYDTKRPWRAAEIEKKVNRAFDAGLRQPREAHHAA